MKSRFFVHRHSGHLARFGVLMLIAVWVALLVRTPTPSADAQGAVAQDVPTATSTKADIKPRPSPELHTAMVTLPGQITLTKVTYEVMGSYAIRDGDIIIGEVDTDGNLIQPVAITGVGTDGAGATQGFLWPNGVIPYVFSNHPMFQDKPGQPSKAKATALAAMAHWEANTDIEFVDWTGQPDLIEFGVDFAPGASECSSPVGRRVGKQLVNSGNCTLGNLIHELGHVVGLEHEHQRSDRELYVEYFEGNVEPGKGHNFTKYTAGDGRFNIGLYDYGSIMHYGCYTHGKDDLTVFPPVRLQTLKPKDPNVGCVEGSADDHLPIQMGQRNGLSPNDIAVVNSLYGFTTDMRHGEFCYNQDFCTTGDIDGNGKDDLITFERGTSGYVWVAFTNDTGTGIRETKLWHTWFCVRQEICAVGDFDGNGKEDLLAFERANSRVWVATTDNTGMRVYDTRVWHEDFCIGQEVCMVGNFNGDQFDDIVAFERGSTGKVWVAFSNSTIFGPGAGRWHDKFCIGQEVCGVGDFNNDHMDDIVAFERGSTGDVWVAWSNGALFGPGRAQWHDQFCIGQEVCGVGDFNGDGKDDIVAFMRSAWGGSDPRVGDVFMAQSTGLGFHTPVRIHEFFCIGQETCAVADINGDTKDDLVAFVRSTKPQPETGDVWVAQSRIILFP